MSTLNLQVGSSADDAVELATGAPGQMQLGNAVDGFGRPFSSAQHLGFRFTGVSGLSGATINASGTELTFRPTATDSGGFVGDWFADDQEAPPTFTGTNFDITNRTPTTATCEGDGSDFTNWTSGSDETFTGDGVNTIKDIIQELADSYDPSAIVLFWLYDSGSGERVTRMYDGDTATAAKLDIDFTAGGGGGTTRRYSLTTMGVG